MANLVIPRLAQLAQLAELVAGEMTDANLHLYSNDYTPSVTTLLADLVQADFTGYAASDDITWNAPGLNNAGVAQVVAPSITFTQSGTTVNNTVYGAYLTGGTTNTLLLAAWRFDSAVGFGAIGAQLTVVLPFTYGSQFG